jgi:ADP-ribose pyrophosphatase YjhB (NUDIX family)
MDELQLVMALVRRGGDLLMIRQAGPGEEPFWTIPGGRVEPGEFVTEALVRELREEAGLEAGRPGPLAFTVQVDERRDGWFATVWTWLVPEWEGTLEPSDPDGYVLEARWVPLEEALALLRQISWHRLTAEYLTGELEPRSVWLRRVEEDGSEAVVGPL